MKSGILAIAALAACSAQASETMRCGKWVVDNTATLEELVRKCGEPASKESKTEEIRRRNGYGSNSHSTAVGTTTTERWLYQRSSRALRMVVTIQDGKVESIDKAP
jgi:mannose/cellobiose epimerase-like protein (N-acyl-D-glucosamine 2-epimerase family)